MSTGFPRQEYCSGLPFPSPGDIPEPGIELEFPALAVGSLWLSHHDAYLVPLPIFKSNYLVFLFVIELYEFILAINHLSNIQFANIFSHSVRFLFIVLTVSFLKIFIYLFIWLCWVLVVACGIFSCVMWDLVS